MTYKNNAFRVSFVAIMLALIFLFQFLEKFMSLGMGYVKLNISIIFIIVTYFVIGLKYSLLLFILRFAFGPAIGSNGYSDIGFWSHFILLVYGFLFFATFILMYKWSNNLTMSIMFAIFKIALISGLLNGLLFTPVYWAIFKDGYGLPVNLAKTQETYAYLKDIAFFGISDYWGGMFAIYTLTNVIKFSIVGFVLYSVLQFLIRTPYKKYVTKISTK